MMYSAASILYVYFFVTKKQLMGTIASTITGLGLLAHTGAFAMRWYSAGYVPIEAGFESLFLFAWFAVFILIVVEQLYQLKVLGMLLMPIATVLLGFAWSRYKAPSALSALVKSYWIGLHVSVVFVAYAGFTLAAAVGILYLIQESQLKKRSVKNIFFRRLPSLEILDDLGARAIIFALPFITMTMITGIIRATTQAVQYWFLDPLVISTVTTWTIYGFYLGSRYIWGWRGRRTAVLSLIGFGGILFIRFVVISYLTVFHQFGT
jgi:cytochrome c-type biogenesis protein CcsB